ASRKPSAAEPTRRPRPNEPTRARVRPRMRLQAPNTVASSRRCWCEGPWRRRSHRAVSKADVRVSAARFVRGIAAEDRSDDVATSPIVGEPFADEPYPGTVVIEANAHCLGDGRDPGEPPSPSTKKDDSDTHPRLSLMQAAS